TRRAADLTGCPTAADRIDVQWSASSDPLANGVASGLDGYSVFFDAAPGPACDETKDVEEDVTSATSAALARGTWYAHVCARDNAGNWAAVTSSGADLVGG